MKSILRISAYAAVSLAAVVLSVTTMVRPGYSMGTPPFDADLRSGFSAATKALLEANKCLASTDSVEVVSKYRTLRPQQPIVGKSVTVTLSFPGKDRKGSRLITVSYNSTTDSTGTSVLSIPLTAALQEVRRLQREDRFYRGVKRMKGPLTVSFTTADTLERSVRYVPARGLNFRLCRAPAAKQAAS
jgi:hypothetical protein